MKISHAGAAEEIAQALSCTFMYIPSGTCTFVCVTGVTFFRGWCVCVRGCTCLIDSVLSLFRGVKIALSSFSAEQIVENVMGALDSIVAHIPHKWSNVQSVYLRGHDSVALPLFSRIPVAEEAPSAGEKSAAAAAPPLPGATIIPDDEADAEEQQQPHEVAADAAVGAHSKRRKHHLRPSAGR